MIPLLFPLLALIAGIVASPCLHADAVWLCLPAAILLAIARRRLALLAFFLAGAGLRAHAQPAVAPLPEIPEAGRVTCTLLDRPDWRGLGVYLDVRVHAIDGHPYQGRARLTEFLDDPELRKLFDGLALNGGDRLEIVVRLRRPATYRNPGVFDYRRYLEQQGIYWTGTIRNPRLISVLERGAWIRREYGALRDRIEARLARNFADDRTTQGLMLGMVLGRKHDLTPDVERDFQAGGLYHMVVVSGFNLGVVAAAAGYLARFLLLRRRGRILAALAAALAYALLVGSQPPVTRAVLIVGILAMSRLLDRDYSPLNALALAALVLLVADPLSIEDSSFQMTFAAAGAVAGIGIPAARWLLHDLHEKLRDFGNPERDGFLSPEAADWRLARRMWCELHGLPCVAVTAPWRIWQIFLEALTVSVAVETIFAFFMVESFHRLAPISPLLNVPAGILAAVLTPLGLVLILLPEPIAAGVAWTLQQLVHLLVGMLHASLSLPHASLRVPSAPAWMWVLYLLMLAAAVAGIRRRQRVLAVAGVLSVFAAQAVLVLGDFSPPPPRAVTVTFLDVGQGDSILVEFPDGRRMLIDGGGVAAGRFLGLQDASTFSIGENVVSAYLFSRGIRKLDVVALTHAHNDHLDGLSDVLSNFKVGELWLGRNPMIPAYRELIETAQSRGVPLRLLSAGQQVGSMTVLHPPPFWRTRRAAENNDSLVLLLRAGRQTALFTGDLELAVPLPGFVNLLKVAHHGSRNVRMRVQSEVRVISVGANNPFGHPHVSALPALRTDVLGAIEVRMEGGRPQVRLP